MPFEIPKGWCWVTFGTICKKLTDGSHNPPPKQLEGYTVISAQNIKNGRIVFTDKDRYTDEIGFQKENPRTQINKGDIILGIIGGSIGNVGIYEYNKPVIAQRSISIIDTCISNLFCFYLLQNQIFQSFFLEKSNGNAQAGVYLGELDKMVIPLPPLTEQQRIVTEIEHWFALINQIEQDKSDLQTVIKQAKNKILDLAIHGKLVPQDPNDEPAIELLRHINPDFTPFDNGHSGKLPYEIPETWVWCGHNFILDISGGSQPAKNYFETTPKPNYIRLYQIRDYGESPVPVYIPINLASKQTEKGDILLARYGGSLGKVFHAEQGAYNVAMAKVIFKFDNLIYKEFAYYYYLSDLYQGKLKEISRTAQAGFNSTDFNDMYFPLPPINEQRRIVQKIEELFSVLDNIQKDLRSVNDCTSKVCNKITN
ncbi:restriction endonuclease subunit S [uncultured Odoribacter sp.]|uniref:restriction endonuclease subunit S n=1 Tax=uncultured Odoribacter sp. TaxID=876416 RepID=UPI002610B26B|nr:restriction endonuclease subunit S [uncultured Odoribacter sp.]